MEAGQQFDYGHGGQTFDYGHGGNEQMYPQAGYEQGFYWGPAPGGEGVEGDGDYGSGPAGRGRRDFQHQRGSGGDYYGPPGSSAGQPGDSGIGKAHNFSAALYTCS